jgi:hypothetical protein
MLRIRRARQAVEEWAGVLDLCVLRARALPKIHQFPDGTIVEALHTHTQLELLDRYLAGKAVIGAVKADEPASIPGSCPGALIKLFIDVNSAAFCTTR